MRDSCRAARMRRTGDEERRMTSPAERVRRGRAVRKITGRASHGRWTATPDRPDPIGVLQRQATDRVPELLPIRYGRMAASPLAFLRGAAAVMAADLATQPQTGLTVQLCGDAHLMNFGMFASPERALLFDLNDFDETYPGPFEWDVKRLAASIAVAARDNGHGDDRAGKAALAAARAYRRTIRGSPACPSWTSGTAGPTPPNCCTSSAAELRDRGRPIWAAPAGGPACARSAGSPRSVRAPRSSTSAARAAARAIRDVTVPW
ncbi:hypothetical protein SAVIM40S_06256 [Streptomyces avidinii]